MPPDVRLVFVLFELEDLSVDKIAELLSYPGAPWRLDYVRLAPCSLKKRHAYKHAAQEANSDDVALGKRIETIRDHGSISNELLEAGKGDELSADRRHRLVASIGFAVGAPPGLFPDAAAAPEPDFTRLGQEVGSAGQAAVSHVVQSGSLQALVTKIVGATVVGGLSVWGGYALLAPTELSPGSQSSVHLTASSPVGVEVTERVNQPVSPAQPGGEKANDELAHVPGAAAVNVTGAVDEAVASDSSELTAKARKHPASDSLARELAMIETGRAELLRSNPSATLNTLSKYRKEFSEGHAPGGSHRAACRGPDCQRQPPRRRSSRRGVFATFAEQPLFAAHQFAAGWQPRAQPPSRRSKEVTRGR